MVGNEVVNSMKSIQVHFYQHTEILIITGRTVYQVSDFSHSDSPRKRYDARLSQKHPAWLRCCG